MARARGAASAIHVAFETTYGTAPTSGFYRIPFITTSLGSETAPIENNVIGQGRDPVRPINGPKSVTGDIVVPMDFENLPLWWKLAFGDPTTTGSNAPYSHAFTSGASTLPSMTIQISHEDISEYRLITGVRLDSLSFSITYGTLSDMTCTLIGRDETNHTTSQAGSTIATLSRADGNTRFTTGAGSFMHKGSELSDVVSGDFTYSNGLIPFEAPFNDNLIIDSDLGRASATGTLTVALSNANKYLIADDANDVYDAIQFNFDTADNTANQLRLELEDARVDVPPIPITSDDRIDIDVGFTGTGSGTNRNMVAVRQINGQATYT